jgi:hypothetical protein
VVVRSAYPEATIKFRWKFGRRVRRSGFRSKEKQADRQRIRWCFIPPHLRKSKEKLFNDFELSLDPKLCLARFALVNPPDRRRKLEFAV